MSFGDDPDTRLVDKHQLAAMLNVSTNSINYMRRTNQAPNDVGRIGRRLYWRESDVREWLKERSEQGRKT